MGTHANPRAVASGSFVVDVALSAAPAIASRTEECGVARVVAVGLPVVLCVSSRRQRLVTLLAPEAAAVPILPEGGLPLGCNRRIPCFTGPPR